MKVSREQFDTLLLGNQLVMSLIGMSNIGKSHWSKKLASESGFHYLSCDDVIEMKLAPALQELGYSGIADISRWMGQPYDERFVKNQRQYLSYEQEAMEDFFDQLRQGLSKNCVIDTTGSVVHTGEHVRDKLRVHSLVVFIEATESMKDEMFRRYIAEPKPVVFGDFFTQRQDETQSQALERSYRTLLDARSSLYNECADVILPYPSIEKDMSTDRFISLVRSLL